MTYHCIIVGGGIAALQLAHHLKPEFKVLLLTKGKLRSSNTYRAQGGIAAAVGQDDLPHIHFEDTIRAGQDYHNYEEVTALVNEGPFLIGELQQEGLHFDQNSSGCLDLGLEGAHSRKRIVHCGGDESGKRIAEHLIRMQKPDLAIRENRFVFELILDRTTKTCVGVKAFDEEGNVERYYGRHIVLATGGVGGLYEQTSNDLSITGDGIALAYRAGAEIADMEFVQFHPTLLTAGGQTYGLVSEAVRGKGARLVNSEGKFIMNGKHPLGDLAPRHIVAHEMNARRLKGEEVFLDITTIHDFQDKFPTISKLCNKNGISIKEGKLPVSPGCHFLMGGIVADSVGRTSVPRLYAIGETAMTGVHGANRLASNSLLEGLYYGRKLALYINELENDSILFEPSESLAFPARTGRAILPEQDEIRSRMMKNAGMIRTERGLAEMENWLDQFAYEGPLDGKSVSEIQTMFMLQTAKLIVRGALLRKESRGAHIREDYPDESEQYGNIHIIQTKKGIEMRDRHCEYDQITVHA